MVLINNYVKTPWYSIKNNQNYVRTPYNGTKHRENGNVT